MLEFTSGCAIPDFSPQGALGAPDYNDNLPFDVTTFAYLGDGGTIKLGFTDNVLTNSGDPSPDIFVFEIGDAIEASQIFVRPLDAATRASLVAASLTSVDNDDFYYLEDIAGSVLSIDIDQFVGAAAAFSLQFDAIKIRDIADRGCAGFTPGADIDAVCALSLPPDCAGTPGGTAVFDECGVCLEPTSPAFNQACADCAGTPNGTAIFDECGVCLDPNDPTFNQACADCAGTPNGTAIFDECGVCLESNDPTFNQACADCASTPNGTAIFDECGVCLEPNDPTFNQACADCAGTPNGTAILDECGVCLQPNDSTFNQACADCAGTPNGTAIFDECGVCLEPNDPTFNLACADCAGTPNGTAIFDECGVCSEPQSLGFNESCKDCAGTVNGLAQLDTCGVCLLPSDPSFNTTCTSTTAPPGSVAVPTAFSPNGDSVNDRLRLFSTTSQRVDIDSYSIFNRWGNKVFSLNTTFTGDAAAEWTGHFRGREAENGVYTWILITRDGSVETGTVILMR